MRNFHAVMIDETGCEFGADTRANSYEEAEKIFRENYPESRIDQIEDDAAAAARQRAMYDHIAQGGDWDDDGRPIHNHEYDLDDEE
jgi:hypothetical protein